MTVQLVAPPIRMPNTQYWLITCAPGSVCERLPARNVLQRQQMSDSAALPYYLMIGDSISLGYLSGVQKLLAGKFNVVHSVVSGFALHRVHFVGSFWFLVALRLDGLC